MPEHEPRHYVCIDCGVRLAGGTTRAQKHEANTGHKTRVNVRAEQAHLKYKARQNASYLARLDQKIAQEEGAWL